ncbi:MAG TPA: hypothetical protein DCW31_11745 [Lactobacillus sp.]|nr:hypothetical protein [Lactobacillus sp.]
MSKMLKNKWVRLVTPVIVVWVYLAVVHLLQSVLPKSFVISLLLELGLFLIPLALNLGWLHQEIGIRTTAHGGRLWRANWYGIYVLILTLAKLFTRVFVKGHTNNVLNLFILAMAVGLGEEYVFRGLVLPLAIKAFSGKRQLFWGVMVSSLLFGLTHLANLFQQPLLATAEQVLMAFAIGTLLAAVYLKTGNIIFAMVTHALQDFQVFLSNVYVQPVLPVAVSVSFVVIVLVIVWLTLRPTKKRTISLAPLGI